MSKVFVTHRQSLAGSRVIRGLLSREVPIVGSPTTAGLALKVVDGADSRSSAPGPFVAADRDAGPGRLDAVAGSEFLDDRIRLRE